MSTAANDYELAQQLHRQGRLAEAAAAYARFLQGTPNSAEAQFYLGAVLFTLGRLDEAVTRYTHAIELRKDFSEAHNNLGKVLHDLGLLERAVESYRIALRLKPNSADPWYNLGTTLNQQKKYSEAMECLQKAIALRPDFSAAHCRLGTSIHALARLREAQLSSQAVVDFTTDSAATQRQYDEAEFAYRQAIAHDPSFAEAYHDLGSLFQDTGRFTDAAAAYKAALALKPELADTHWSLGELQLLQGNLTDGWNDFAWRWQCEPLKSAEFVAPLWRGQSISGKSILLRAEGGFGDIFHFIRYAKLVKQLAATVAVTCPVPLQKLLATCPGLDQVYGDEEEPPMFDFESTLMTLPGIFGTTLETIPADVPYLFADSNLIETWKVELADVAGRRIGINWHGGTGRGHFGKRDFPFEMIARLGDLPGVKLISLQQGAHTELNHAQQQKIWLPSPNIDTANGAFMDTAAIIMNLDLVITSDTAIAHLAGALGKPVWILLPYVPDWRWLLDRNDSPWYPSMRLFRQPYPGDWQTIFHQIATKLTRTVVS